MRTIVVGFDGNDPSTRALEAAVERAGGGAQLVVVAVAPAFLSPEYQPTEEFLDGVPVSLEPVEPPEIAEAFDKARDQLGGRIEADYFWAAGDPADVIVDVARERAAELIVVGDHHHSLVGRLLGTDVSHEVEQHAPCEVLVVP